MAVGFSNTNKPINPRGLDASPKGYNRAALYSGKALDFDGVNDEVNIGAVSGTFSNLSMSWYIKTTYTADFQCLFADGAGNFDVYVRPDKKLHVWTGSQQSFYEIPDIQTGEWVNLVLVKDGANASLYYNGQLAQTIAFSGSSFSISNGFVGIGLNSLYDYNGEMAGFKIFNTALTAAQVADLYNNPEKIVPTGVEDTALKLWLPMMEGAGTTAYDGSGNGNHGTISGATWTHGVGSPVAQTAVIDWNKGINSFTYSEDFSNANWITIDVTKVSTSETDYIGGNTAANITWLAGSPRYFYQNIGVSGASTLSFYVKSNGGGNKFRLFGNGTLAMGSDITATSEWVRYDFEFTGNASQGIGITQASDNSAADLLVCFAQVETNASVGPYIPTLSTAQTTPVLLPQGLTTGRDITGVNLFENVRKQGALNLDGNSWAEVHDNASLDITDDFTLEAWIKDEGIGDTGILGKWYGASNEESYLLYRATDNRIRFYVFTNAAYNIQSITTMTTGNWYHIVGTYDGSNFKIYMNGTLETTAARTGNVRTTSKELEIGRYYDNSLYSYNDQIAQPRIYNRALTAEEVLQNYNSGKSIYQ